MWYYVIWWKFTDILEDNPASIFKVENVLSEQWTKSKPKNGDSL